MGRRYGQHFLHNSQVLEDIVSAADLQPGQAVLEVGPGQGALTQRLLSAGAQVTAVEVDPDLAQALAARWGTNPAFRLVLGDVRQVEVSAQALFDRPPPYRVVANLPYYLTSELLLYFLAHRDQLDGLILMVQKEVGRRMAANTTHGKAYGSLSIAIQHGFAVEYLFTVPPGAFTPPPGVDSAVVRLKPLPPHLSPPQEARFLDHVLKLFQRRRKLLLSTLKALYPHTAPALWSSLEARLGQARPENLSPAEHLEVFCLLHQLTATPTKT